MRLRSILLCSFLFLNIGCQVQKPINKTLKIRAAAMEEPVVQKYDAFFAIHSVWWANFCDYLKANPHYASQVLAALYNKPETSTFVSSLLCDQPFMSEFVGVSTFLPLADTSSRQLTASYLTKKHGSVYYNIPINPIGSPPAVFTEPRVQWDGIDMVFQFDDLVSTFIRSEVSQVGRYTVTIVFDLDKIFINIKSTTGYGTIGLNFDLSNYCPSIGAVRTRINALIGDVNGDDFFNDIDKGIIASQLGVALSEENFRCDINLDGQITAADLDIPQDLDGDWDVDGDDYSIFDCCATGPGIVQTDPVCLKADFDGDGDVDQADFGILQRCLSGKNIPVDPRCLN